MRCLYTAATSTLLCSAEPARPILTPCYLPLQHDWRMAEWILCWVGCGLFLLLALL